MKVLVDHMNYVYISFNMARRELKEKGIEEFTEEHIGLFYHTLFNGYNKMFKTYGQLIIAHEGHGSLDWRRKIYPDYKRNRDTKVLIMDNPFGPISSEHLLKPLFNIAEKYNTQLICLTDLKQNSILNCFNLIYMIKIRQNVFGTNEYLQLEKQIKDGADIETDEMLEKAVFQSEQITLM